MEIEVINIIEASQNTGVSFLKIYGSISHDISEDKLYEIVKNLEKMGKIEYRPSISDGIWRYYVKQEKA